MRWDSRRISSPNRDYLLLSPATLLLPRLLDQTDQAIASPAAALAGADLKIKIEMVVQVAG